MSQALNLADNLLNLPEVSPGAGKVWDTWSYSRGLSLSNTTRLGLGDSGTIGSWKAAVPYSKSFPSLRIHLCGELRNSVKLKNTYIYKRVEEMLDYRFPHSPGEFGIWINTKFGTPGCWIKEF